MNSVGHSTPDSMAGLARIVAPHFVAGIVMDSAGRVTRTAPIFGYMRGWTGKRVAMYCQGKGWTYLYMG